MKRRQEHPDALQRRLESLIDAVLSLRTREELSAFLQDLCTPAELQALAGRWEAVPLILEDMPYREIHERTGVSVTTVGRVARCVDFGAGGYRLAADRLGFTEDSRK